MNYEAEMNQVDMTPNARSLTEDQMVAGLLEAAGFREDARCVKRVQIQRDGALLYEFRIHPLSEEDIAGIRKHCTRYAPDPRGARFGRVAVDVDIAKLHSRKIYQATVEEDQRRLWDNRKVQQQLNCMLPEDVIEQVLMAGEKGAVVDLIDKLSGYGSTVDSNGII